MNEQRPSKTIQISVSTQDKLLLEEIIPNVTVDMLSIGVARAEKQLCVHEL